MTISSIIKSMLVERSIKMQALVEVLDLSSKQALSNKFANESWSAEDLIKVAGFLDGELILRVDEREVVLTEKHLKQKSS